MNSTTRIFDQEDYHLFLEDKKQMKLVGKENKSQRFAEVNHMEIARLIIALDVVVTRHRILTCKGFN